MRQAPRRFGGWTEVMMVAVPEFQKLHGLPYGSDCGGEKTEALKARVCEIKHDIFYFKELSVHSAFQLDTMFDHLHALTLGRKKWELIIDVREASEPTAEIRAHIRRRVLGLEGLRRIIIVLGGNPILRIAARFVIGQTVKTPHVVVDTLEEAFD